MSDPCPVSQATAMKTIVALIVAAFCHPILLRAAPVEELVPGPAGALLDQALLAVAYRSDDRALLPSKSLEEMMDELPNLLDQPTMAKLAEREGDDIKAKIAMVANARRQARKQFEEIERIYFAIPPLEPGRPPRMADARGSIRIWAPRVQPSHLEPEYRYAWEFCALKYENKSACRTGSYRAVKEALLHNGQDTSVILFEWGYAQEQQRQMAGGGHSAGEIVRDNIWGFPTARGVRGLLNLYATAQSTPAALGDWRAFATAQDFFLYEFGRQPADSRLKWQVVLAAEDRKKMSLNERKLIQKLIDFQPPAPEPNPRLETERGMKEFRKREKEAGAE
jgi:hypothetical protein